MAAFTDIIVVAVSKNQRDDLPRLCQLLDRTEVLEGVICFARFGRPFGR